MKKTIVLSVVISALFLASCSSPSQGGTSKETSLPPSMPSYTPYEGQVDVHVKFINGQTSGVSIDKGQKFIVGDHFEGYKAYTDDFYSQEYHPSALREDITLYLRPDDGTNVLAIYDIVDNEPSLTTIGTYPMQSGLYPKDFEFQLYTNSDCTSKINLQDEIIVPTQGLKLYRKGRTNPDYFRLTFAHYLAGIYDKEDDAVAAMDYIISGYALKYNSGIPQSDWAYTTFQFDNGQNINDDDLYAFTKPDQVIVNCYINKNEYHRISVYDIDTGEFLGVIPWAIESSFYGKVDGYEYSAVVEWNFNLGVARVSNSQKLLRNDLCLVYNGHVVCSWTNYAFKSVGFNYEYQDRDYYLDIGLTNPVEHRTYNTDITVYAAYK